MKSRRSARSSRRNLPLFQPLESRLLMSATHHATAHWNQNNVIPEPDTDYPIPAGVTPGATTPSYGATSPLSAIPVLNSHLGAKATIYLDFNGDTTSTWGTYSPGTTPAFDQDGDPTTFSTGETSAMQEIWARVSEKYSPFNINVTTVDPGIYANGVTQRVVFGGAGAWLGAQAGGVSYVGAFTNSAPNTSWVFTSNLANNAKYSAEAAAHEVGHSLGLQHQSTWSGTSLTNEYNPGSSARAPIMGNSYTATRGLWWNGTNDVSSTTVQDDLSVLASSTNGFGYRADDYGNSVTSSLTLTPSNNAVTASGVIEKSSDADYFGFTSGAGAVTFTANPAAVGGMLDLKLELRDGSGNLLTTADTSSLGESLTFNLTSGGKYYVDVASHGTYGDIGQYTLSGIVQPQTQTVTVAAPSSLTATPLNGVTKVNLNWKDNSSNETGFAIQRSADNGSTWSTIATVPANYGSYLDATGLSGNATYSYRVTALSGATSSAASNIVAATSGPAAVTGITATALSTSRMTLSFNSDPGAVNYYADMLVAGKPWGTVGQTAGTATTMTLDGLTPGTTYQFRVWAVNSANVVGAESQYVTLTMPSAPVPLAPTNLRLSTVSSTQIRLDWNANATNATGQIVETSTDGVNWTELADIGSNWTAGVDGGLTAGTTYYYRIKAYNSYGSSAYSNVASLTTPAFSTTPITA